MVKGLNIFREHFKGFEDRYVLIGGTASSIIMEEAGAEFRATKDLDIVLCIEALDSAFVQKFWDFIENGGYSNKQKSSGKKLFYRFHSPADKNFPTMLELFSKVPDSLEVSAKDSELTPIPVDEEISSLSAILLDSAYYDFIHQNITIIDNLPIIGSEILIPLKAKAWLDLSESTRRISRFSSVMPCRGLFTCVVELVMSVKVSPSHALLHHSQDEP
ncbi:MAG: hypothetical protein PQJ48_10130 [Sphaerochaetaceae bacterium]|nr:hypothetical protein [Sphaerochaetaceae bacterium]